MNPLNRMAIALMAVLGSRQNLTSQDMDTDTATTATGKVTARAMTKGKVVDTGGNQNV